ESFDRFLRDCGERRPAGWDVVGDNAYLPLTWKADAPEPPLGPEIAERFCKWLTERLRERCRPPGGVRITSEAEWEFAARGPEGRRYPWGDDQPDQRRATYESDTLRRVDAHPQGVTPETGIADMAGNAFELCRDRGGWIAPYKSQSLVIDPDPQAGSYR